MEPIGSSMDQAGPEARHAPLAFTFYGRRLVSEIRWFSSAGTHGTNT